MKLLYFAWLRSRIGHAEEQTTLPEHVRDVAGLLEWLRGRGPATTRARVALRSMPMRLMTPTSSTGTACP